VSRASQKTGAVVVQAVSLLRKQSKSQSQTSSLKSGQMRQLAGLRANIKTLTGAISALF
jgi:hypothetical protein